MLTEENKRALAALMQKQAAGLPGLLGKGIHKGFKHVFGKGSNATGWGLGRRAAYTMPATGVLGLGAVNAYTAPDDLATLDRAGYDRKMLDGNYSGLMAQRLWAHPLSTVKKFFKDTVIGDYRPDAEKRRELDNIIRQESQNIRTKGVRSGGTWLTNRSGYRSQDAVRQRLNKIMGNHFGANGEHLPPGVVDPRTAVQPIKLDEKQQQEYLNRIRLNLSMAQNNAYYGE